MKKSPSTRKAKRIVVFSGIEELRAKFGLNRREMAQLIGVSSTSYTTLARRPSQVMMKTLTGIINGAAELGEEIDMNKLFKIVTEDNRRDG